MSTTIIFHLLNSLSDQETSDASQQTTWRADAATGTRSNVATNTTGGQMSGSGSGSGVNVSTNTPASGAPAGNVRARLVK